MFAKGTMGNLCCKEDFGEVVKGFGKEGKNRIQLENWPTLLLFVLLVGLFTTFDLVCARCGVIHGEGRVGKVKEGELGVVMVFGGGKEVKVVNDGLVMVAIVPTTIVGLRLTHSHQLSIFVLELDPLNGGKDLELFGEDIPCICTVELFWTCALEWVILELFLDVVVEEIGDNIGWLGWVGG